jgi:hypothetical protein
LFEVVFSQFVALLIGHYTFSHQGFHHLHKL